MLISLSTAQRAVSDALPDRLFRLAPKALAAHWLRETGHFFLGASALRAYKHRNQWRIDDRDLTPALEALSRAAAAADPPVPTGLPWTGLDQQFGFRDDWRLTVQQELIERAAEGDLAPDVSALLDAGAGAELRQQAAEAIDRIRAFRPPDPPARRELVVAGLAVCDLLTRVDDRWCLPSAWHDVLDTWQQRRLELVDRARRCVDCGATEEGYASWAWRTSGQHGWITRCQSCAAGAFQRYTGSLTGVLYTSTRRKRIRADDYLCVTCEAVQATAWDHCHEHDFVRGPVCASCNSSEGAGTGLWGRPDGPGIAVPAAVRHLLACQGCRSQGTLPPRYLSRLVTERLLETERHDPCRRLPTVQVSRHPDPTSIRALLTCPNHQRRPVSWEVEVHPEDLTRWVADLTADHERPLDSPELAGSDRASEPDHQAPPTQDEVDPITDSAPPDTNSPSTHGTRRWRPWRTAG